MVNRAADAYRGEGKTDARDAHVIADQARMRQDLQPVRPGDEATIELKLLTGHRIDLVTDRTSLLRFLRRWYGAQKSPNARLRESPGVPRELVEWHEISAQWGGEITSHNYAIPLAELAAEDGKIPFWVENQGTWVWAFDPKSEESSVYERHPSDEPTPWRRTGERLSDFLIHATILEAILWRSCGESSARSPDRLALVPRRKP
ncbi:hypothetical protein GCM10022227_46560 [Streptomyces sedi]